MRQLNKAVNAWGSLRAWCMCVCTHVHTRALVFYLHQGPQSRRQSLVPHTQADFPKE